MDRQVVGHRRQRPAEAVEQLLLDRCLDVAARGFRICRLVHTRPAATEPVGLVGLVILGLGEFLLEVVGEFGDQPVGEALLDDALFLEPRGINRADLGMLADLVIHQRLGELGLVALVVPEAAIAPHVDHDVAAEGLAVFDRQLAGEGNGFGIVAVDVQDRRLDALGDIRGVGRRTRELRARGEADLVVDDEVQAAAGVVAPHAREAETFPHDALTGKGRVAVKQDGQDLLVLLEIVADRLLCAALAEHDRVDRFKVAGVGDQRHMHVDAVEFAVGAGAEVVFHIARTADVVGIGAAARKFVEDDLVRLAHDVGEHVEAPAVGHAVDDLAHAQLATVFDDRFERGDHAFAAIEAEALRADVFLAEERLVLFAADHCREDGLLAFLGELDRVFGGLELVLQETAFFRIRNVHVFEADIAAIGCAQCVVELADLDPFEAEHAADIDFARFLSVETVPFERQVLGHFTMRQAERVEIGRKVAAHAI